MEPWASLLITVGLDQMAFKVPSNSNDSMIRIFVDFSGRVRSGFSWNLDSSMMVLGPAEPVEHNDRISLSAGALHKSKDVYPACGGSLDWKVHLQSCSHACLPASPPTPSRARAPTTSKPPRNSAGLGRFTEITGWALLFFFFFFFFPSLLFLQLL